MQAESGWQSPRSPGSCVCAVSAVDPAAGRRGECSRGCGVRWELWTAPRAGLGQTWSGEGLPRTGGGPDQESPSASRGRVLALGSAGTKAAGFQSWDMF